MKGLAIKAIYLNHQNLYNALSKCGNPRLDTSGLIRGEMGSKDGITYS